MDSDRTDIPIQPQTSGFQKITLTSFDDWHWQEDDCSALLSKQLGARQLAGYGLEGKHQAIRAAGACLHYASETQRTSVPHITDIHFFEAQDSLVLDAVTLRNLELIEGQSGGGRQRSLLGVIDRTVTGMGARLLRSWLMRPSIRRTEIDARLDAVGSLLSQVERDRLRELLKGVSDLERLVGRIHLGTSSPRDMVALRGSLEQVPLIREALSDAQPSLLQDLRNKLDELPHIRDLIARSIAD